MNLDRRLISLVRQEPRAFLTAVLMGLLEALLMIGQAYLLSRTITILFLDPDAYHTLPGFIAGFAALGILRPAVTWTGREAASKGSRILRSQLHERLVAAMAHLGPSYTTSKQSGQLSTLLLRGIEALDPYFSQYIPQLVLALTVPFLIAGVIIPGDLLSGLILLLTAPLIPLFMVLIGKAAKKMTDRQWKTLNRTNGYFLDMLQGLTTLKLFGQSRERIRSISEISEEFRTSTMNVLKVAFLSSLTLELVGTIGTAIIAVQIGIRLLEGYLDFQTAFFVLLLTPDFYQPLRQLGTRFHAGMEGASAANDIFAILEQQPPVRKNPKTAVFDPLAPITFDNVSLTYPDRTTPALDNVSFTLSSGKVTALVGPSGAGKTTITHLVLRFIRPSEGSVATGTTDLGDIPDTEWLQHISWVPQHPWLFHTTIRENLLLAREHATQAELMHAIELAGLAELIDRLPEGLDTVIGEQGARLSGGEAQRVSIARAFLRNAPILVLDEPTSHTDPRLEESLQASLDQLMQNRTTLVIAHRLKTIRNADTILVLHNGRIIQKGTHRSLMDTEGYYRNAILSTEADIL